MKGAFFLEQHIGKKVKELRTSRKMTLKELSGATDFSISYLSQVERGVSSISVYSLEKVAKVLGVELAYFLEMPNSHQGSVMRSYETEPFYVEESRFIYHRLGNNMEGQQMEPIQVDILPSKEGRPTACPHEGEEFIYVLEGILTVLIESEEYELYPGDSMHYQATIPHEWVNRTTKMVRIISVNTPTLSNNRENLHRSLEGK